MPPLPTPTEEEPAAIEAPALDNESSDLYLYEARLAHDAAAREWGADFAFGCPAYY